MTASQVKTTRTTVSAIVGSAAFRAGVSDYQSGATRFDDFPGNAAWHYERGRLFAAVCAAQAVPVPPSRSGRRVSRTAIAAVNAAFIARSVI